MRSRDVGARAVLAALVVAGGLALGLAQGAHAARRPAQDTWRVSLAAFPDTVGVAGYACSGCDRSFTGADDMAAAANPLQPMAVVIHRLGNRQDVYWHGIIRRDRGADQALTEQVLLTAPPPYQVSLLTTRPLGYTLCPNARADVVLKQSDFDAAGNAAPGTGRGAKVGWYFWSCRAPGLD
jgi:hypothetical protein